MMFVRVYTVLAVCVVVQGRAVFTAHVKNKCVMMIDEEYTICLRFARKKTVFTAHVQENGMVCWL